MRADRRSGSTPSRCSRRSSVTTTNDSPSCCSLVRSNNDGRMLADILRYWARWQPEAVALRFEDCTTTWAALHERTDRLAAGLVARGVEHGDRIGVLLLNRPEFIDTCLAAWKIGAVPVPLNVRYTAPEAAFV